MGIQERIRELEDEIKRTQKNKATEFHIGLLKAKIAKLRRNIISTGKGGGAHFDVKKSGDATIAIIGFPSVGKSTLLGKITSAESKTAAYEFTTLTCVPGMLEHKGARMQILDLPGIIEGAKDGRGRGREVISVARNSDLILVMLDARHPEHYEVIVKELYGMGIRLNTSPPDLTIKKMIRGGLIVNSTVKLTKINEKIIKGILNEYGVHNGDVVVRQNIDTDQLIDVLEGNRVYLPAVVAMNKIDLVSEKELRKKLNIEYIPISAEKGKNLDLLVDTFHMKLGFMRIYTKPHGEEADMTEPLVVRKNISIGELCRILHREMYSTFRYALVWGKSAKHSGQRVGLEHRLQDGDIVSIVNK
ncbi:GTP-binding protein [Candidatus Micrarchaeota archaeon]|nr:GTP-binding protein [Candidatus Micrarchaeota archaeon]